jgi:hypothetical protein
VDRSNRRTKRAYEALEDPDIDGLLDAASVLSSQLKQHGQFPIWLESAFGSLSQDVRHPALLEVLRELHTQGAVLLTTNYDDVLETYCSLERIGRSNRDAIMRFRRGDWTESFIYMGAIMIGMRSSWARQISTTPHIRTERRTCSGIPG